MANMSIIVKYYNLDCYKILQQLILNTGSHDIFDIHNISFLIQGNSVARDLPRTGSETNTTIFVIYIYIGYRFPLSLSTIWGNHLPVNFMLKFPTCILSTILRNHLPHLTSK